MVALEEEIAPKLQPIMPTWRRYVDDTFTFVKKNCITEVVQKINSFHPNIKFTHEIERDKKIAFLDVLLSRKEDGGLDTSVYRKPTNNNIYIHWNAYGPRQWKIGTLSGIIRRAYEICSTEESRKLELDFISDVFVRINGYPHYVVNSKLRKFEGQDSQNDENTPTREDEITTNNDEKDTLILQLPFRGTEGESLIRRLKNSLRQNLPNNIECRIVHTGSKLSQFFSLKDKVDEKHLSNFIYKFDCRNKKCNENYVGETARHKEIRENDHAGKDKDSHVFKHTQATKHPRANKKNFVILAKNYENRRKRKLAEAMFIRDLKTTLDKQNDSYKLVPFG